MKDVDVVKKDVKDKYAGISTKDVASSIIQVKDIDVPEGKNIIDIVADQFILEDGKIVADPVGKFKFHAKSTSYPSRKRVYEASFKHFQKSWN